MPAISRLAQPLAEKVLGAEPLYRQSRDTCLIEVLELLSEVAHRLERGHRRDPAQHIGKRMGGDDPDGPVVRRWTERDDDANLVRVVRNQEERRRSAAGAAPPSRAQAPFGWA
ncbi:MAG: hypothetical protein LC713_06115, partial [Actinobacteria bacterium]|nr:hypothetical protein [Actinomycetota bacterium]